MLAVLSLRSQVVSCPHRSSGAVGDADTPKDVAQVDLLDINGGDLMI
jgi:hypothetical protein